MSAITGLPAGDFHIQIGEGIEPHIHPEDVEAFRAQRTSAFRAGDSFDIIRVNMGFDPLADLNVEVAGGKAGNGRHPRADCRHSGRQVPFKLAKTRHLKREMEPPSI